MTTKKRSGFEIISALEHTLLELDAVDPDSEDEFNMWLSHMEKLLGESGDKMLSYRIVLSLAKKRKEFFSTERERYAKRARVQARVIEAVKDMSHMMLESHCNITGESRMDLSDGTWATLAKRASFEFYDAETGEASLDPRRVPPGFVRMEISKSELKRAAKNGEEIEGVEYKKVEKTHVRWS